MLLYLSQKCLALTPHRHYVLSDIVNTSKISKSISTVSRAAHFLGNSKYLTVSLSERINSLVGQLTLILVMLPPDHSIYKSDY